MHNECDRIKRNHERDAKREQREENYKQLVCDLAAGDEIDRANIDAILAAAGRDVSDLARDCEIQKHKAALSQLMWGQ